MKIPSDVISIMSSFVDICKGKITFLEGDTIHAVMNDNPKGYIVSVKHPSVIWDREFYIDSLSTLLALTKEVSTKNQDADITLEDTQLKIKNENIEIDYKYSRDYDKDRPTFVNATALAKNFDENEVLFMGDIEANEFSTLVNGSKIMKFSNVVINENSSFSGINMINSATGSVMSDALNKMNIAIKSDLNNLTDKINIPFKNIELMIKGSYSIKIATKSTEGGRVFYLIEFINKDLIIKDITLKYRMLIEKGVV